MTTTDRSDGLAREAVEAYYETGSGDEVTLRENEQAWAALRFRPRVLVDVARVDTSVRLLGRTLPTPVLVAPSALHGLAHPDGERESAAAAAAAGALFVLSSRSSVPIEQVGAAVGGAPWWFQVYAMRDRELTFLLAEQAVRGGATALVLTGDTPVVAAKRRPSPGVGRLDRYVARLSEEAGRPLTTADVEQDPTLTSAFIRELADRTGLPVLVKGVLRADDAAAVVAAGAAGVLVSNHGGRQLDRAVATATALPEVVEAVGGEVPVLVDGGIRSGADVLAALALGADAVLLGRPVLRALMAGGGPAVQAVLEAVRLDLESRMRLIGAPTVADLTPDLVAP